MVSFQIFKVLKETLVQNTCTYCNVKPCSILIGQVPMVAEVQTLGQLHREAREQVTTCHLDHVLPKVIDWFYICRHFQA